MNPIGLAFLSRRLRLDVVEFISWLDAAKAFEDRATVLERVRAAQMADS